MLLNLFSAKDVSLVFSLYFDGHLGDKVPAYLQKHLFQNILKEGEFWTDTNRSIFKAYEKTDQAILSHSPDLGRGGSTAVTAILINGRQLWVANLGDSRAVLSRGGQAIQLSVDHEPNTERGSIENRGGFVSNMPGDVARVNGQLAVSRAFGDRNLKSHLRSDPDVTNADIDADADILILASDGLWKVVANQEAVDIAKKIKDPQKAAKQLVAEALDRQSKDDISCIVRSFQGVLRARAVHHSMEIILEQECDAIPERSKNGRSNQVWKLLRFMPNKLGIKED
ncbi:phytochrome-associated protein phosphatase type 2C [Actinidia rufa]|uniref:protein-serine/threonine phosphatase n=1 Tax=Actinidia rufa TaxID=165716 RepID=A0A7J0ESE1_9ERIC|nr:phytochrome-associated protein phosphatase type 2C [Actinidia rufa]